jgi:hypothetical protein
MEWNRHICFGPRHTVCFMAHSAGRNPSTDEANAKLIAAAPDLLEALKNCAEQLQTFRGAGRLDEPSGRPSWTELDEVRLWESRAAIAKATS